MKSLILVFFISATAQAWDSGKCSKMLNEGLYMKYKWGGVGDSNVNAMTQESKKSGQTSATTKITTEATTAGLDPKYTSNVVTSQTQSISSFGECDLFALLERRKQRELFFEQNREQIKNEIAHGQGAHLEVLSWFSMCENSSLQKFNKTLQKNYETIFQEKDSAMKTSATIDTILKEESELKHACYDLSAL